jgi:predicted ATPase
MLIAFVGTPSSGKTTTAARLFADLKDAGYPAEFLPETARLYIAERRLEGATGPLVDGDQDAILCRQEAAEKLMFESSPESITVADSAAVNALLYMTEQARESRFVRTMAKQAAKRYTLVFRCHPVQAGTMYDPNRVHSFADSQALDTLVEPLLTGLELKFISLFGPQKMRAQRAYGAVLEAMVNEKH